MKKIKERTYVKRLSTFIIGFIIGWFFYLLIVATVEDPITRLGGWSSGLLSLLTMVVCQIITEYNYLKRLELTTASLKSNISVYKKRETSLMSKAEKLIFKFLDHENDIQKSVASSRSGNVKERISVEEMLSIRDLRVTVENYPDLKSDKHIFKILEQLEESQNIILNSKLLYNEYVTYYNSAIVSFPSILFSVRWKLNPLEFYVDDIIDEI